MATLLILGVVISGIALVVVTIITARRKRDGSLQRIARIEKAIMKTKDDPVEPARFVP